MPSGQYTAGLRRYLAREHEVNLQQAYELGRRAIASGLGVLDMARIHQEAVAACVLPAFQVPESGQAALQAAETFLLETLSPFEAAHRGFREANAKLRQLNRALEQRNTELNRTNRELASEIAQRQRVERALRRSEEHYRQLFQRTSVMEENLRSLSNQILHAQEEERKRISRELHDEVGQALTAVSTNLILLRNNGTVKAAVLREKLTDLQRQVGQTMESVHRFARELRPAMLDELGLVSALSSYLKGFADRTGLRVRFQASPAAEKLGEEQKIALFRVAQESLTNVAKHACASRVGVTLREVKNGIRMRIADNGKAFRVEEHLAANGKKRLGLLGMAERVRLANGRFAITSTPGRGTAVRVDIPFRGARALATARNLPRYESNHRIAR